MLRLPLGETLTSTRVRPMPASVRVAVPATPEPPTASICTVIGPRTAMAGLGLGPAARWTDAAVRPYSLAATAGLGFTTGVAAALGGGVGVGGAAGAQAARRRLRKLTTMGKALRMLSPLREGGLRPTGVGWKGGSGTDRGLHDMCQFTARNPAAALVDFL